MQHLPAFCISQPDDFYIREIKSPFLSYLYHKQKKYQYLIVRDESNAVAVTGLVAGPDATHYGYALARWKGLLQDSHRQRIPVIFDYRTNLSGKHVRTILLEWWHNRSFDAAITTDIVHWIQQAAMVYLSLDFMPRISSPYNYFCFMLWYFEMSNSFRHADHFVIRDGIGSTASKESAVHRLAHHTFASKVSDPKTEVGIPLLHNQTEIESETTLCCSPTAAIDPCFWLQDLKVLKATEEDHKSPLFLWDTLQDRTTRTQEVPYQEIRYVAISHTWGRWTTGSHYSSPGVPWPIPENSMFDVRDLPRMLKAARFSARYIWLDLLCIPQEQASPELKHLGKIEIANQATIFRSAIFACAWLNNVPSWRGIRSAIKWLSLQYIGRYSSVEVPEELHKDVKREAWGARTYLLDPPTGATDPAGTPSRWFTSLWTLQELCMCPNMLLYDFSWRPLEVNGFVVPFDHIVALFSSYPQGHVPFAPSTVTEIYNLLRAVGLGGNGFLRMSPISVLILGNQRYCRERRAEAIMSVIGVTSWFDQETDSTEEQLVLDRYPLSFLHEIKQIFGASFFCWHDIFADQMNDKGTMLPFSDKLVGNRRTPMFTRSVGHRTVSSWTILPDGSVLMPQAVVLASFPRRAGEKSFRGEVRIPASLPEYRRVPNAEVDMHEYLAHNCPDKEKYVIALLQTDASIFYGLLLERQNESSFRKIGLCHWMITGNDTSSPAGHPNIFIYNGEQLKWLIQ